MPPLIAIGSCFYNDVSGLERMLDSVILNLPMKYVKVFMIDGPFKGYDDQHQLSSDGSRDLIDMYSEKYGHDKIVMYNYPNVAERFKRQYYVDLAAKEKIPFLLILDSDEWLDCKDRPNLLEELTMIDNEYYTRQKMIAEGNEVRPVANVHNIRCVDRDNMGYIAYAGLRPRLWYHPEEMTYTTRHFYWKRKDQVITEAIKADATDSEDEKSRKQFMNTLISSGNLGHESFTIQNLQMWHDHSLRTPDREEKMNAYEKRKN